MWGLCVPDGGGGRRHCRERAGVTVNFFGAGERCAGVRCSAGLGGSSFGGKNSWGGGWRWERIVLCSGIYEWTMEWMVLVVGE